MRLLSHLFPSKKNILSFFLIFPILFFVVNKPLVYADITINEILPKTEDSSKQWIELYNSGNDSVSLNSWRLENTSGEPISFGLNASFIIDGHGFLTFYQTQTGITLNKNGDSIRLINEKNTVIDSQSYPGILGYNVTMGRTIDGEGIWSICSNATPNKINNCPVPTSTPIPPTSIPTQAPTAEPTIIPTILDTPTVFLPSSIIIPSPLPMREATPSESMNTDQWKYIAAAAIFICLVWICFLVIIIVHQRKSLLTKPPSHHST